jgi:hypothetical protein
MLPIILKNLTMKKKRKKKEKVHHLRPNQD